MLSTRSFSLCAVPALLALAACSDAPVGPSSPLASSIDKAANSVAPVSTPRVQMVEVTFLVYDYENLVPLGTTIKFTGGATTITQADNAKGDTDARVGYVSVMMPKVAHYSATVVGAPIDFSLFGGTSVEEHWSSPLDIQLGRVNLHHAPQLFVNAMKDGQLYPGQTIQITGPSGFSAIITDGGPTDTVANGANGFSDGKFYLRVPQLGSYTVCPKTPLASTVQAKCMTLNAAAWGGSYGTQLTYKSILSLP